MKPRCLTRYMFTSVFLFTISIATILTTCTPITEDKKTMRMQEFVPDEVHGWKAQGEVEIYDRETIFDYIDGAGEVYRSYGFQKLVVLRLVKDRQPTILVELFDMGSPEDAYGIFSHAREGEEMGIGQGSEYRGSLLCFWKGNFFVCIFSERQTPETKKAVFDLARKIAKNIKATGSRPKLLAYLPTEGLLKQSVRYFHLHTSLNYHYYVASENILKLSPRTEAVFARYQKGQSYLLLVRYPDQKEAGKAFKSFVNAYIPEAKKSNIVQIEEGKWVATKLEDEFVVVVFDASSKAFAQALIEAVGNKLLEPPAKEVKN